jgi:hypothetical protein
MVALVALIIGAVLATVAYSMLGGRDPVHAQGSKCAVPKSYGAVKAPMVFEATDGTLRMVDPSDCTVLGTITRQ